MREAAALLRISETHHGQLGQQWRWEVEYNFEAFAGEMIGRVCENVTVIVEQAPGVHC